MTSPKEHFASILHAQILSLGAELALDEAVELVGEPPNRELGDLSFPCFTLARQLRNAPPRIAGEIASKLGDALAEDPYLSEIKAVGPYVNARLDPVKRARRVLSVAVTAEFGKQSVGQGKRIGIDYSSPNIAKPFGIGHLRSTAIGNALRNIFTELGYEVVGINHLGDWGTQFGKLMAAFEEWGVEDKLAADPIGHLYELYVKFHQEAKTDPTWEDRGRAWFKRLEDGDEAAEAYWTRFRDLSLREFERIYGRLGVSFDHYWGEAFYNDKLDALVHDVEKSGLGEMSEGAFVVPLDDLDMPPCLIRKSDGATLYATRDLAAARYRVEELNLDQLVYVVGVPQTMHFRQVFAVLERMGYEWATNLVHVAFGHIHGISTRKGTLVFLEEILETGKAAAREILADRDYLTPQEKETVAEQVTVGAVVFYDLLRNRIKDYDFSWDLMLRGLKPGEPGKTGPYLQYTNTRIGSVVREYVEKVGELPNTEAVDFSLLSEPKTLTVIAELERFPKVLKQAGENYEPSVLSRYLLDLAAAYNAFYSGGYKIVSDDAALSAARITLTRAVSVTLSRGLTILGVPLPERM